jgi:hypothetical protein
MPTPIPVSAAPDGVSFPGRLKRWQSLTGCLVRGKVFPLGAGAGQTSHCPVKTNSRCLGAGESNLGWCHVGCPYSLA